MIVLIAIATISLVGIGGTIKAIRTDGYRPAAIDVYRAAPFR